MPKTHCHQKETDVDVSGDPVPHDCLDGSKLRTLAVSKLQRNWV